MEEKVKQKLMELRYDPRQSEVATPTDIYTIFRKHLGGLILFSGKAVARSGHITVLEDENICVATSGTGSNRSLYINPLEKRIKEEYISIYDIQLQDNITINEQKISNLDAIILAITDIRQMPIVTFEFYKKGEMLYIPRLPEDPKKYDPAGIYSKQNTE